MAFLRSHDVDIKDAMILSESILIRNEFYCGRRFHTATHEAVWFMEEEELKIFRRGGDLLATLHRDDLTEAEDRPAILRIGPGADAETTPRRRAA